MPGNCGIWLLRLIMRESSFSRCALIWEFIVFNEAENYFLECSGFE